VADGIEFSPPAENSKMRLLLVSKGLPTSHILAHVASASGSPCPVWLGNGWELAAFGIAIATITRGIV